MEYCFCFIRSFGDEKAYVTEGFSADSDQEALRVYQDFCRKAEEGRLEAEENKRHFYLGDIPNGFFRIDQREIVTRLDGQKTDDQ